MSFGIDCLSVFALSPVEFVKLAADLKRPTISTILEPFAFNPEGYSPWSLRTDPALRRAMIAEMSERGVSISQGEGFVILPGMDVREQYAADLGIMAELGAPRICAVAFDPDVSRSFDQMGIIAEMAAAAGIETLVEFAPCSPSLPDLKSAIAVRRHVGRRDFRLLIDTMHLARSGGTASELAALEPDSVGYVQLCDTTKAPSMPNYLDEAMYARKAPGEGDAPLLDFLAALPADVTVGLEVPLRDEAEAGYGPRERMSRVVALTEAFMGRLAQRRLDGPPGPA